MSTPGLRQPSTSPARSAAQQASSSQWRLVGFTAALAMVAFGLTSCGDASNTAQSDESTAESSSASTAPSEGPASSLPGEDELAAGLLTIDDVPTGWAEVPQDDSDDPLCGIRITELLGLDADSLPSAAVEYAEDSDTGPAFGERIGFVPAGRGGDVLPALDEAIDRCDGSTDGGLDVTVTDLSFPSLGDDSAAYRITYSDPDSDQSVHFDLVYAMSGDLVTIVSALDFYGDPIAILANYAPKAVRHAVRTLGTTPPPS